MSGNVTQQRCYPRRPAVYTFGNSQIDIPVDMARAIAMDILLNRGQDGGFFGSVAVSATSPATLTVEVAALEGYSRLAEHLRTIETVQVDCSKDHAGAATVPTSGNRWISIFAKFKWDESDPHQPAGYPGTYYGARTEDVDFLVYKGTATQAPSYPGSGMIRVCDILLTENVTHVAQDKIYITGSHQDTLLPLSSYLPLSGGKMSGGIRSDDNLFLVHCNHGQFQWGDSNPPDIIQIPVGGGGSPFAWPERMWGLYYSVTTIVHGMGNVDAIIKARPNLPDTVFSLYADVETWVDATGGGSHYIFTINSDQDTFDGTSKILVVGTLAWVESMVYYNPGAQNPIRRHWRWHAIRRMV